MKNFSLLGFIFLLSISLVAQNDVIIGKYRKFESKILGGEVTYLEHLPDGYETSGKTYPVLYEMNGQITSQFANDAATLDNLSCDRVPDMILIGISNTGAAGKYWSCPDDSGFDLGDAQKMDQAIEICKYLISLYPDNEQAKKTLIKFESL